MTDVDAFPWWRRVPIHTKLQVATAAFALVFLLGSGSYLMWATRSYFDAKVKRDLLMLSEVIAENSRAAVAFSDAESASKVLSSLKANKGIVSALIKREGKTLAAYPDADAGQHLLEKAGNFTGVHFYGRDYIVNQPIIVGEKEIGRLILRTDSSEWEFMEAQLQNLFLGLFLGLVTLVMLIYLALRAFIIRPLSNLSAWASSVAYNKRFDALAVKESADEIGQLVDSLNLMLTELAKQQGIISLNQRLTEEVNERKRVEKDLREMRVKAELANEAKSRFLANMSHEIRTPMNVIMGFVEIVLESELSEEQRKHLSTVKRSANLLHSLLNDILDVSKLEEGKLQLEKIPFSVHQLVADLLKTFEMKASEKHLNFGAKIDPSIKTDFIGDPLRISQILINMIGNAIKFTDEGCVEIEVVKQDEYHLLFSVSDTGIGIAQDKIDYVFQNFAQADTSVSRKYGGSGLGTTISKQLVELMGGKIWVESELGIGSTFYCLIPLESTTPSAPSLEIVTVQPTLKTDATLRILVVEDVVENAELLKFRLEGLGHEVIIAENGAEAVGQVERDDFDIVLMDVQMPIMDGLTATRHIRNSSKGASLPILALTASVLKQNRTACVEAGMNGFVAKPVVFAELYSEMARVLVKLNPKIVDAVVDVHDDIPIIPGVDREKAALTWRDADLYLRNLILFARSHKDAVKIIRSSLEDGNIAKVRKILHALKGAAGNLALTNMYSIAQSLSQDFKNEALEGVEEKLSALGKALGDLVGAVLPVATAEVINGESMATAYSFEILEKSVALLCAAFRKGVTSDDLLRQVISELRAAGASGVEIDGLVSVVDEFEFEKAIALMLRLVHRLKPPVRS